MTDQVKFRAYMIGVLRSVEHLMQRGEDTLAAELRNFLLDGVTDAHLQRVAYSEEIHIRRVFWADAAHTRRFTARSA